MAYFHIDRAQAYLQALGFPNVLNRPDPRERGRADPGPAPRRTARTTRSSTSLTGELTFGTGWADDAEDAETIAPRVRARDPGGRRCPGFPAGSDAAAAIGEGFGRLLRLGDVGRLRPEAPASTAASTSGTRSPSGLGDCLRRVDWGLRLGQILAGLRAGRRRALPRARSGPARSGRSARRARRPDRRRPARDPVALQPQPDGHASSQAARALLAADSALYGGVHRDAAEGGARAPAGSWTSSASTTPRRTPSPLALPGRVSGRLAAARRPPRRVRAEPAPRVARWCFRLRRRAAGLRPPPAARPGAASVDAPRRRGGARGPSVDEEIHYSRAASGTLLPRRSRAECAGGGPTRSRPRRTTATATAWPTRADVCPTIVRPAPARLGPRRRSAIAATAARSVILTGDQPQGAGAPARTRPDVAGHAAGHGLPRCACGSADLRALHAARSGRSRPARRARAAGGRVELRLELAPRPLPPASPTRAPRGYRPRPQPARAPFWSAADGVRAPARWAARSTRRSPRAGATRCARSTSAPWSWRPGTRSCARPCSASWT